jgi:hypothetical protein
MFCAIIGNFTALYRTLISIRTAGQPGLVWVVPLLPVYWLMMSIAVVRAFVQLFVSPWHWEKTVHGLDRRDPTESIAGLSLVSPVATTEVQVGVR